MLQNLSDRQILTLLRFQKGSDDLFPQETIKKQRIENEKIIAHIEEEKQFLESSKQQVASQLKETIENLRFIKYPYLKDEK